ncbi:MAG: methyl-accepting chemotaxis protein, partial [Saccharospirillaceae bacterium]|nr:methyl-accepting chemotaxis protein [Pseudomonadales bacterium]NRB80503.1 methyl-accepting chemotaxis protein [Saccharospirillaceae bacterium]
VFTKKFDPMFNDLLFDLENWQESEVILFEVQSIVLSGLLFVEQIKTSTSKREVLKISGGPLLNWMSNLIPVAIKLKNKENNEQTDKFVTEVFAITEKVLEKVRGLGGPEAVNAYGLTPQKVRSFSLNAEIEQHLETFNNAVTSISESINLLVESSRTQSIQIEKSVQNQFANSRIAMITISLVGLVIAAVISFVITLTFKSSLRRLKEILAKLAQGDFTSELTKPKNDELGDLERYIKTVSDSLKELIGDIQHTFKEVEHSVQNSRALSKQTRGHVVSQKEQLESVGNALKDMKTTAAEVAKYAEQTHDKVEHADEFAKQGAQKVNSNQMAIQSVSEHFKQAQTTIIELDTGVHNIEDILQTIGSIADQTNLLALNAAIEAARAGEQGRGFAVVADEVRSLANRTQQSTAEIQAMTMKMINGSKQAVQMMQESNERIDKSMESAQEAKNTISEFSGIMDGIRSISHLIATAAEEQSLVSNEVSGSIVNVTTLAEKTEKASIEATDSAKQLKQLSIILTEKLAKFKI